MIWKSPACGLFLPSGCGPGGPPYRTTPSREMGHGRTSSASPVVARRQIALKTTRRQCTNAHDAPTGAPTDDSTDRELTVAVRGETMAAIGNYCEVSWANNRELQMGNCILRRIFLPDLQFPSIAELGTARASVCREDSKEIVMVGGKAPQDQEEHAAEGGRLDGGRCLQ